MTNSKQIKFSVPYNGDEKIVEYFIENKRYIEDVYFGLPSSFFPSGRIIEYNKGSEKYLENLFIALEKLKLNKIKCSLLINSSCEGDKTFSKELIDKYKKTIDLFYSKGLITNVVLFNPVYISELKKSFKNLKFSISVNSGINTLNKAKQIDSMGFDTIIIDRDINHKKDLIKKISENVHAKIKLLVNECCLNECLFRASHFNCLSHPNKEINYKEIIPCVKIFSKEPWRLFKSSFILPNELKDYSEYVDVFKIAGRSLPTKLLKYSLDIYFKQEKQGDLLAILSSFGLYTWRAEFIKKNNKIPRLELKKIPDNFRSTLNNCNMECKKCKYCSRVFNEILETY